MSEEHTSETTLQREPDKERVAPAPARNSLGIPVAIVVAAALIASAIYFDGLAPKTPSVDVKAGINAQLTGEPQVAPVTEADHIKGNPNAPIMIVEYSDYDCPFCRIYHDTLTQIIDEYGASGKVAWVYRHFPIVELHPNAPKISEAAYCVSELGGNDAFWKFNDALNGSRTVAYDASGNIQSVDPTNMSRISEFAVTAGVDKAKFELCFNSGKYTAQVQEDVAAATAAGARGTPHSIVIVGKEQGVINGAQPYEVVKSIVENLIKQLDGAAS